MLIKIINNQKIYLTQNNPYGNEWFATAQEARFAAIGHISLMERMEKVNDY